MKLNFVVLPKKYSIYRFRVDSILPDWMYSSDFYSITKTNEELSVIAVQKDFVFDNRIKNDDWRIFKIVGPLDFSLIGIIADVSILFKERMISIFTVSTYDTDYLLIKQKDLSLGVEALRAKGHKVAIES